jgi:hypothetical protein
MDHSFSSSTKANKVVIKMIEKNYLHLIKRISKQLSSQNIKWALTGSTSFAMQGVPITPNDIDIQTDKDGAYTRSSICHTNCRYTQFFNSTNLPTGILSLTTRQCTHRRKFATLILASTASIDDNRLTFIVLIKR